MAKKSQKPTWIVGIDEVGRGPLAGPVCVAAAAMPIAQYRKIRVWREQGVVLADSKKMSQAGREIWERKAKNMEAEGVLRITHASYSAAMIDRYGISRCIKNCIARVLKKLDLDQSEMQILLDGGLKAPKDYPFQTTVIRGDDVHKIISLASVVAKVKRDAGMKKMHKKYSQYAWDTNKGYGTAAHVRAIRKYGQSPVHRTSFISRII